MTGRAARRIAQNRARRFAAKGKGNRNRYLPSPISKAGLFTRWKYRCCYCDGPAEQIDHVTPVSKGGRDTLSNVVPACTPCNQSKGALSLSDWAASF
ncbi:HNH endonuclease [Streptomyces spectabilis]|uniref:HNH endonuclease n=1 Tax=Streptomyces spectabilis TaxID=68270 RepID=UPI001378B00A